MCAHPKCFISNLILKVKAEIVRDPDISRAGRPETQEKDAKGEDAKQKIDGHP